MATFIQLTTEKGEPILINLDLIESVSPHLSDDYPTCISALYAASTGRFRVRESLEEIKALWEVTRWIP